VKRIVLCCDGTWNSADQSDEDGQPCPTNVVRLAFRVAKRDDKDVAQIVYYDAGVGTGNTIDRITGGAIGAGLEENIHDAYRFLIANYEYGDELFVFGFSRGAFTARSTVGMLRKCGILGARHLAHYGEALALYRNNDAPGDEGPKKFRQRYCAYGNRSVDVRFIGVWDTVGALGIPIRGLRLLKRKYEFHDTELSGIVKHACHALAIDEHRAPFEPAVWVYKPKPGQTVEQVWFCGAHSDVGGGYPRTRGADGKPQPQLADIPLDWMIGKARAAGLHFDREAMDAFPLALEPRAEIHNSKTGLYRLVPAYDRVIGLDPTQTLHPSVKARWGADPSYRPEALVRYFKKRGQDPFSEKGS
jgi:uncharacterized protein (DUF2235 family)